jgi:hypothetical protein
MIATFLLAPAQALICRKNRPWLVCVLPTLAFISSIVALIAESKRFEDVEIAIILFFHNIFSIVIFLIIFAASLLNMGDRKERWRISFIVACGVNIIASIIFYSVMKGAGNGLHAEIEAAFHFLDFYMFAAPVLLFLGALFVGIPGYDLDLFFVLAIFFYFPVYIFSDKYHSVNYLFTAAYAIIVIWGLLTGRILGKCRNKKMPDWDELADNKCSKAQRAQ